MFRKLKTLIAVVCMKVYANIMNLLYKNELKEFEDKLKNVLEANKTQMLNDYKKQAAILPEDQKELMNRYASLQNEVFKAFLLFTKEIQKTTGPEMDGVAQIWITTVNGLNKTLQYAFAHQDDEKIRKHLFGLDQELQLAIDTNQEIIGSTKLSGGGSGGFGYSGPIGEA